MCSSCLEAPLAKVAPCAICTTPPDGAAEGYVHSIETCGSVDGPGMRYIVFLSGCPLRCLYCHNPDTRGRSRGQLQTADEVIDDVVRYRNFIKRGGLTVSGGEPLMQPEFVRALFARAKAEGIHTALDTSGFLGDRADDALLELTDLVLLDIKSGLPDTYKAVTGVDLAPTLRFAQRLDALGKPVWLRFVLVPGLTDAPDNIRAVARFIAGLSNVDRVEILPFHKFGEAKYEMLGMPYELKDTPAATEADVERARNLFAQSGVMAF